MMRLTALLLIQFLIVAQLSAQISSGGTPLSFSMSLDDDLTTLAMPEADIAAYLAEDKAAGWDVAPRFGVPYDVVLNLNNSGTWTMLNDGSRLWRCRIASRGAYSINLQFDEFYLPPGATLFIYNDNRSHVIGAFTSKNNKTDKRFATQPVQGDAITLEYHEPASQRARGVISIWRVVHAYRDMFHQGSLDDFGDAAWCAVNINCPEGADWQDEKRGVAMIIAGDGTRWCSGSLLNNARNDGTPYFNTASHCVSEQDIGTWVFIFNYESPDCEIVDGPLDQSIAGGTYLMHNYSSDFALVEISEPIPVRYNPYFEGWNAVDVPAQHTACISHPAGDVKKIGIDNDPAISSGGPHSITESYWLVDRWEIGHVQHGSSGAPLFDQDGYVIGQVNGGQGWCDDELNYVLFGKFGFSFDSGARQYLDPDSTGVRLLDGYDPNQVGPPPVTGLVVRPEGNNIVLSWDSDDTPYYLIYSSLTPEIPFPYYEGMTEQTSFTIENGCQDDQQFYYVLGYLPR